MKIWDTIIIMFRYAFLIEALNFNLYEAHLKGHFLSIMV